MNQETDTVAKGFSRKKRIKRLGTIININEILDKTSPKNKEVGQKIVLSEVGQKMV